MINCAMPGQPGHPADRKHRCGSALPCEVCGATAHYGVLLDGKMHWFCSTHWPTDDEIDVFDREPVLLQ